MASDVIGGIEGGATMSTCVLVDLSGQIIAKGTGPGTNHFLTGMNECRKRIVEMINGLKKEKGISVDTPLLALGLSLSGCEKEETNQQLVKGLLETYPNLSEKYTIGSDTEGSVAATSRNGGVCCIAGTGSNTLLINPDGRKFQCGGWGYLLGDEGSAWKIALSAVKYCFNYFDDFETPPYPIDWIWEVVKEHFKVESFVDLLDIFYTHFDKAHIAGLCKKIAVGANEGDKLCIHIFTEAGSYLAQALSAVIPKAAEELVTQEGGIHILCVGSVWLSWSLLKAGFITYLKKHTDIQKLSLMRIKTTMAIGAAYMAADKYNIDLPRDYTKNYDIFYTYSPNECACENVIRKKS